MDCPKCGKPLKEGAKFCIYCGEKLTVSEPAQQPKPEEAQPL